MTAQLLHQAADPKVRAKEFLAGLSVGTVSPGLKHTVLPLVNATLIDGARFEVEQMDLEVYAPGDPRTHPDGTLLAVGSQRLIFEDREFEAKKPQQSIINGISAIELAKIAHDRTKGAQAMLGHFGKWDVDVLRSYEPILSRKYGGFTELPNAIIDIMSPMRGIGISASQAHICAHYDLVPIVKQSVNLELWQRAALGQIQGLTLGEVMRARRAIRDDRNKHCLEENLAELAFVSQNIRHLNKLTMKEVYPNQLKMEALLGEN